MEPRPTMNTRCTPVAALVALALLLTPALHAAPVTRTTANVSGPGDVGTAGKLIGAMNVGANSAPSINGVNFAEDPGGFNTALAPGTGNPVTFQIPIAGQRKSYQVQVTLP